MVNGVILGIAVRRVEPDFGQELVQIRHQKMVENYVLVNQLSFVLKKNAQWKEQLQFQQQHVQQQHVRQLHVQLKVK